MLITSFTKFKKPQTCNFTKKETPTQVFSCKFCEISNGQDTSYTAQKMKFLITNFFSKCDQSQ